MVMQKKCQRLADRFNELGVPKKISFVDACVLELVQRPADHTGGLSSACLRVTHPPGARREGNRLRSKTCYNRTRDILLCKR